MIVGGNGAVDAASARDRIYTLVAAKAGLCCRAVIVMPSLLQCCTLAQGDAVPLPMMLRTVYSRWVL